MKKKKKVERGKNFTISANIIPSFKKYGRRNFFLLNGAEA